MGSIASVTLYLCVCVRSRSKTTWAINTKLGTHILYGRTSACIDANFSRSNDGVKPAFHDADINTDILARILAGTSDTRDFLKLFLWQHYTHDQVLTFSRQSSRGCRRGCQCRCRRRGMRLPDVLPARVRRPIWPHAQVSIVETVRRSVGRSVVRVTRWRAQSRGTVTRTCCGRRKGCCDWCRAPCSVCTGRHWMRSARPSRTSSTTTAYLVRTSRWLSARLKLQLWTMTRVNLGCSRANSIGIFDLGISGFGYIIHSRDALIV